jgi:anti-anti-sigma factor
MAETRFAATVRAIDGADVIQLSGDIDRAAAEALERVQDTATADGRLLLDFTDVGYINSTGIALIVGLLARARTEQREVAAFGLSDHYREIFSITRLVDFMTIYRDETDAVGSVVARGGDDAGC